MLRRSDMGVGPMASRFVRSVGPDDTSGDSESRGHAPWRGGVGPATVRQGVNAARAHAAPTVAGCCRVASAVCGVSQGDALREPVGNTRQVVIVVGTVSDEIADVLATSVRRWAAIACAGREAPTVASLRTDALAS